MGVRKISCGICPTKKAAKKMQLIVKKTRQWTNVLWSKRADYNITAVFSLLK
jgi:hypothetical protein